MTCLSCVNGFFFYLGVCESSCPASITITNAVTNECDACNVECAQCAGTVDNCTSCASNAALYNGSCVASCPTPLVINNGECTACDSSCLTCDTVYTNCTSCNTSSALPFLHNNQCLVTCPEFYYSDSLLGLCQPCSALNIGCNDCLTSSTCDNCDANFVFLSNQCHSTTPTGYVNISGIAHACTGDCLTCSVATSNCTSCTTLNLDGNDCVSVCTSGLVPVNRVCQSCTSPCKTCHSTQTNCTSCIANLSPEVFLSGNNCVQNCPDHFYEDSSNNQCTGCVSPCQLCTTQSACQSCVSGYFLLGTNCETSCSFGYVGISRVCQPCTSPC